LAISPSILEDYLARYELTYSLLYRSIENKVRLLIYVLFISTGNDDVTWSDHNEDLVFSTAILEEYLAKYILINNLLFLSKEK